MLARKFRPQSFDQVIGQEAITRTLVNSLKGNRVHHAYVFTGARGVGKTTTARILAKSLNCLKGITAEPCNECPSCLDIAASRSIDVQEIDAATYTKIEDTREVIINTIGIAPARDRYKIFIIDEVHQLSAHSFNALLKTIEEPPPRVVFILATTDLQKVPETILSRCQIFEFRTITLKNLVKELRRIADAENVNISDAALLAIARAGEGSMRDAESALDQVISFAGTTVNDDDVSAALGLVDIETLNQTLQAIADQDSTRLVRIVDEVVSRGYDLRNFCREMMVHIRALLVVKIAGFDPELIQLPESEAATLGRLAESFSEQDLLRFFSILTKTEQDIKQSSQPRFQLEIGLVKLAQAQRLYLLEEAIGRIQALESRLGGSASPRTQTSRVSQGSQYSQPTSPARVSAIPAKSSTRGHAGASARGTDSGASSATAAAAKSRAIETVPPEARPVVDEPFDSTPGSRPMTTAGADTVNKLKRALADKNKPLVVAALDRGGVSIDGDYLRVTYSPENSHYKKQIEARDKRIAIEDACEQVVGRRLTLRASIDGGPEIANDTTKPDKLKDLVDDNPNLRALVDKFHGEIIEVLKPEK